MCVVFVCIFGCWNVLPYPRCSTLLINARNAAKVALMGVKPPMISHYLQWKCPIAQVPPFRENLVGQRALDDVLDQLEVGRAQCERDCR